MCHHFLTPLNSLVLELINRNYSVHKSHIQGFLCIILSAEVPDFTRFLMYNDLGKVDCTVTGIELTNFMACLYTAGIVCSNCKFTYDVQHVAAPDCISGNNRDYRF